MSTPAPDGRENSFTCDECGGDEFDYCSDCGSLFCLACNLCDCPLDDLDDAEDIDPDDMPDHTVHRWIDLGDGTYVHAVMSDDASPETVAAVTELAKRAKQRMKEHPND